MPSNSRQFAGTAGVVAFASAIIIAIAVPNFLNSAGGQSATPALTPVSIPAPRGRPLAVEDYYRVKTVGGITLSPDERWVAFTMSTRVEESNGNTSEVWVVPTDASAPAVRVSAAAVNSSGPSWMDDGRLRYSAVNRTLAVNPRTPTRVDTITAPLATGRAGGGGSGGRGGGAGTANGDGSMMASVRNVPVQPRAKVQLTEFEKRHEDRFKGVQFDWLEFHRDGAAFPVANTRDPEVSPPQELFLTPRGGPEKQITRLGLRPTGVQWLKDGNTLIFSADSSYRNERVYGRTDVWSLTTDGALRRLTSNMDLDYDGARLSPDGRLIIVTRRTSTDAVIAKKMNNGGPVDLVVFPSSGGAERVLTADWDYLPAAPQWSPDGRYIYFTGGVGGSTHLFRVSPEGGAVEQLTKGERDIASMSFNRDYTRIVYTVGTFEAPSEIFIANIDGSGERQLTKVHEPFTTEVTLSRSERLRFNSKDGTPIEGWLMFPYGYTGGAAPAAGGTTYPLIVSNHGGPHSAIQYGFNFKNQFFAANGYFVLEINFRSSTGYGEKFLWGTWGAWGDRDGEDVIAGIDHVIGRYPISRNRVGSIGHSYGGFMTNWLITQYPDRIAAAVSGAGIVNWLSDYGNADIPRTKETEFYGAPWDERARGIMIKQSPLTYANRAKAPTLFINGEIDKRVPYSENEQLYVALKKNGVPAKMIQYADQSHGISGHWNNVHRMLNEKRWFDQYLKAK